jgi:hypothetical protein
VLVAHLKLLQRQAGWWHRWLSLGSLVVRIVDSHIENSSLGSLVVRIVDSHIENSSPAADLFLWRKVIWLVIPV